MTTRVFVLVAVSMLATTGISAAQPGGVQWTPDGVRILVNKDVGAERWAITLNLVGATVTGNVFFSDGRAPSFVWCERVSHNHEPDLGKLVLRYRCFGSDRAQGGFSLSDWQLISDQVSLDATFFAPPAETCNLQGALNGPNAQNSDSFWDCTGTSGTFQFQAFGDGTGFSTAIGAFEFDLVGNGCGFGKLSNGSFFNVGFSPSRDLLTLYQTNATVDQIILSECHREAL